MRLDFYLRFSTRFGQRLVLSGNIGLLGNGEWTNAMPLQFLNEEFWHLSIDIPVESKFTLHYKYALVEENGKVRHDAEKNRFIHLDKNAKNIVCIDSWNDGSYIENAFYTTPFQEVFFKKQSSPKHKKLDSFTHEFRLKAPLLHQDECVCLLGNASELNNWNTAEPILLQKIKDWWSVQLNLSQTTFPITYKYGIYNLKQERFVRFEGGQNRIVHADDLAQNQYVVHDGFLNLNHTYWKGAGVAIPVFSLRSKNSFGIGEFSDLKLLVDWAAETKLKLIQLLPINDTTATYTWLDSYPYAAISAFALHPIYINLTKVAGKKHANAIKTLAKKQKQLNSLMEIDYEQVLNFKINTLKELYDLRGTEFLEEAEYKSFLEDNRYWLEPYAAFCFLRDKFGTSDYNQWKTNKVYNKEEVARLVSPKNKSFQQITFYYFVQYHLHRQLKEAVSYAHKKGIALKGDIPIGIYRYGADAWTDPSLYNMDQQAGAPPDDFAVKGQNWGFPTYNWKKMEEDHFEWWRQRFMQMSNYFDAFRIDHILGFFRIWSIPMHAVEGIIGRFIPALPVSVYEFCERGIWFDYDRFCKPYITDNVLTQLFGDKSELIKEAYVYPSSEGQYRLREGFETQREVEAFFAKQEISEENESIKHGLYDLISNVILFEEPGSEQQDFHFRIAIESTSSFQNLDGDTQRKLKDLYVDYFYRRQDDFWEAEVMGKLPALKEATNMLICGEDLGMVPHCVPFVMKSLGILSLEIQRMPKDINTEFFHPKDAPYLSVITPSTHDMSTIRGWWEESREKTQRFYNTILGEQGTAPYFCEPWINRAIVLQHLYSPAMWSIFQLQDLLGMSEKLRRENPVDERINIPANPKHYWRYRMHISLEDLLKEKEFNHELKDYITNSRRN
ncbi:MAG: 4-alpha-glucanotransferase [Chitinophagaceae bacterium]